MKWEFRSQTRWKIPMHCWLPSCKRLQIDTENPSPEMPCAKGVSELPSTPAYTWGATDLYCGWYPGGSWWSVHLQPRSEHHFLGFGVWMVKSWHSFPGLLVVYWGGRNNWTEFGRCIWFQLWGKPKQDLPEFSATRFTGLNSMIQKSMADFWLLNFELTEKEKHPVWLYDVAQKHPGGCETARAFWGFAE